MAEHQETALTKYRGDQWEVSTSDTTFKHLLRKRGYEPVRISDDYEMYELPVNAITIRAKTSLGGPKGNPANFEAHRKLKQANVDSGA